MGQNFLTNGIKYICEATNNNIEKELLCTISVTVTINDDEITIETLSPTDKKPKASTYTLSSKFQGNEIGKSEPFTMYALAKKSKSSKLISPSCFVREYADDRLILVLIVKGIEYEGELKKL